jgi:hypothetical protein
VQALLPLAGENVDRGHRMQDVEPLVPEKVPAEHRMHVSGLLAFSEAEYVPTRHFVHGKLPSLARSVKYEPALQYTHVAFMPLPELYVKGLGHGEQTKSLNRYPDFEWHIASAS